MWVGNGLKGRETAPFHTLAYRNPGRRASGPRPRRDPGAASQTTTAGSRAAGGGNRMGAYLLGPAPSTTSWIISLPSAMEWIVWPLAAHLLSMALLTALSRLTSTTVPTVA